MNNETIWEMEDWTVVKGTYWIGMRKIDIAEDEHAYEIAVRPDIAEEALISLSETVMLSFGGLISRIQSATETSLEVKTTLSNGIKLNVRTYFGVSRDFQRIAVLHCANESNYQETKSSILFKRNDGVADSFSQDLIVQLYQAFDSEGFTLAYLKRLQQMCTICYHQSEQSSQQPSAHQTPRNGSPLEFDTASNGNNNQVTVSADNGLSMASVVDPAFIRDLQSANAIVLKLQLSEMAERLDKSIVITERQVSRLMSVLKPQYVKCNITMHIPPASKSLSSYPLELSRKPLSEPTLEMSRLMILRARRFIKENFPNAQDEVCLYPFDDDDNNNNDNNNANPVDQTKRNMMSCLSNSSMIIKDAAFAKSVLNHIWIVDTLIENVQDQLREWYEDEAAVRFRRKGFISADRLNSLEEYKFSLLETLANRVVSASTSADKESMRLLTERCRVLTEKEPLLVELSCACNGQKGQLFVTKHHLFFFHGGFFGMNSSMKLIPFSTISTITITPASGLVPESVVLTDEGGAITVLEISGPVRDYCSRIADLLSILKNVRFKLFICFVFF